MLRDYCKSMQQPIPDEIKQEYARLPLFELMEGGERPASVAESLVDYDPSKAPGSPKDRKKGTSKKEKDSQLSVDLTAQLSGQDGLIKNLKPKLPLVPRRPLSAFESTDTKKRAAQAAAAKKQRVDDMDERLILNAHRLATQYVNDWVRLHLGPSFDPLIESVNEPKSRQKNRPTDNCVTKWKKNISLLSVTKTNRKYRKNVEDHWICHRAIERTLQTGTGRKTRSSTRYSLISVQIWSPSPLVNDLHTKLCRTSMLLKYSKTSLSEHLYIVNTSHVNACSGPPDEFLL